MVNFNESIKLLILISQLVLAHSVIVLPNAVLDHLNSSNGKFDAWTKEQCSILNPLEQQQLAWNVRWPLNGIDLKDMQLKLRPTNNFKLLLWMSFYWQLRRSNGIPKKVLHQHFAGNLVRLHQEQLLPWNNQLENMLLSFPQSLRVLVKSHWLCLQHERDYLYARAGEQLELGANSNCSMWQIDRHGQIIESETDQLWLPLRNVCETNYVWFINLLTMMQSDMIMLFRAPNNLAKRFCLKQGFGYYARITEDSIARDCYWQLNDCSYLPKLLMGRK